MRDFNKACELIIENIKIIQDNICDANIKLASPEVLADKKLTKYYVNRFNKMNDMLKNLLKIKEDYELICLGEDKKIIRNSCNDLIKSSLLKGSKAVIIEIDGNKKALLKECVTIFLKENTLAYSEEDYLIRVECTFGALDVLLNLSGVYVLSNSINYISVIEDEDFIFDLSRVKIDVFRSSGAGGQKVNKTETAIRATYLDTLDCTICQDERSQTQNKERALERLQELVCESMLKKKKERINITKKQIKEKNEIILDVEDLCYEDFLINLVARLVDANIQDK